MEGKSKSLLIIQQLSRYVLDLENLSSVDDYFIWHRNVMNSLSNVYNYESEQIFAFKNLRNRAAKSTLVTADTIKIAIKEAEPYIFNIIEDIKIYGMKLDISNKNESTSSIEFKPVIQLSQHQSQQQSQEVEILLKTIFKAVDSKLTGDQREELKAILDSPDSEEAKKLQFVDKIKSFGSDVASGILATLLTNPVVYSGIANMF